MSYLWAVPAIAAGAYYLIALAAALARLRSRDPVARSAPPVSILKPVRGRDPRFYEAIRSHATQDYPEYEILFGAKDPADPAIADIRRLQGEFPERSIRLVLTTREAPNGKVAVLTELARQARHPLLLVNDSDIRVEPDYLRRMVAPLEDPQTGVVTCLYRARAESWPGRWEAIGIATEFAPSVLVAPLVGVAGFALGSTMVLRAAQLEQIGGFPALEGYLADDYQLGVHIARLGYRVVLSKVAVETNLSGASWGEVWRHQLRWSRTIRVSRTAGYYGYLATQAAFWSLVAAGAGFWWIALAVIAVRIATGLVVGWGVLGDRQVLRYWFLMPLRDLWGFAIWVAGLSGDTVEWRGQKIELSADGRILQVGSPSLSYNAPMDQKLQLTVTSDLTLEDFESELDTAWSIVQRDPELRQELERAGIDPDALPKKRTDAVQFRSKESNLIPGLNEYLIGLAAGFTVELIKALIKVIRDRKGEKAAEVKK